MAAKRVMSEEHKVVFTQSITHSCQQTCGKLHHKMHMTLDEAETCYPTVRLVKITTILEGVKVFSFKEMDIMYEDEIHQRWSLDTHWPQKSNE